ncbi:MAG TPA: hypothetical protein VF696_01315 [Candidatus Paceibacterota bacterium]|jgi:hypothetical protein
MVPIFARPEEVFALSDRAAFIAFLEEFRVPYRTWGDSEKKLDRLWKEIEQGDAVYTTGAPFYEPRVPVRFIVTMAARVIMEHPVHGFFVLIEFVRDGGFYRPRQHAASSLSEKAKLKPDGTLAESNAETIWRCQVEEARIRSTKEEVISGLHFMPRPELKPLVGGARHVEQDYREKVVGPKATPGLKHFNQIAHYTSRLPEHHHFLGWRRDESTQHLSRWGSVSENSSQLEPIPVELVDMI